MFPSFSSSKPMAEDPNPKSTSRSASSGGFTVEECQKLIDKSLRHPTVKFLRNHLEKSGCDVRSNFIKAVHCEKQSAGEYVPGQGILVCSNHLKMEDEVNQVVIHELIHAYDECRAADLDWSNCAHRACSEIRAAHLSGDCNFKRELLRGFVKRTRGHEQDCVKRRVIQSVMENPLCSEAAAKEAMETVWDTCYDDTQPFERAP